MEQNNHKVQFLIAACRAGKRAGQRKLYELFFSYGMSIALRYSSNRSEAEEILNESFHKVFLHIDRYQETYGFKKWFSTILIHTSIDYYRKYKKLDVFATDIIVDPSYDHNQGWDKLLYEDILKYIQMLPPSYRIVFNLFAIDGYKHTEIAQQLNISVGSSKSNYAKARKRLQQYLLENQDLKRYGHGK